MGSSEYKKHIVFFLDGLKTTLENVSPEMKLIEYLHLPEVGKRGTKASCGQGGCGACTVMMTSYDASQERIINRAINSCLRPLASLDGTMITTTQGIGSVKEGVDPVQWKIAANNGSQCGYCTPGFVMNMFTRMQEETAPSMKEVEELFDGNICRCTGYRPILEGFKQLADDYKPSGSEPEVKIDPNYCPKKKSQASKLSVPSKFLSYMQNPNAIAFESEKYQYFRPITLDQVFELLANYGPLGINLQLLCGNTSAGVYPLRSQSRGYLLLDDES